MFLLDKKIICVFLFFFIVACAEQKHLKEPNNREVVNKNWDRGSYSLKISEGDAPHDIEQITGIPYSLLLKYNKLKSIKPGMKIKVPKRYTHVVKKGESSLRIALSNGLSLSELIYLNDLSPPYSINVGQKLKIVDLKTKISKKETYNGEVRLQWPIYGKLITSYGLQKDGYFNDGVKIQAVAKRNVVAALNGEVVYCGSEIGNYGNMVIIKHKNNWTTSYGNLDKVAVVKGQKIDKGQIIGEVIDSALYFSLRIKSEAVDPKLFLRKNNE